MAGPNRADLPAGALRELDWAIHVLTGSPATNRQRQQFREYLELLTRWNRVQRLTGVRSPEDIIGKLFLDSLLFLKCVPGGRLDIADVGAGAGIPGIPLAIVRPDISMLLIESKRKRVSFLNTAKRELDLQNLMVIEGRAEDVVDQANLQGAFDVVLCRAVGSVPATLPLAMRYLKSGGLFIASGPPPMGDEDIADGPATGVERRLVALTERGPKRVLLTAKKSLDARPTWC